MPTHGKHQTAYCQTAFPFTHTRPYFLTITNKHPFATHSQNRLKWSLIKQWQNPTCRIFQCVFQHEQWIPASHHSSLIQHVLKVSWQHQRLSLQHTRYNVCMPTCLYDYDWSPSPLGLSAWICVCFWHPVLSPWSGANFAVSYRTF